MNKTKMIKTVLEYLVGGAAVFGIGAIAWGTMVGALLLMEAVACL